MSVKHHWHRFGNKAENLAVGNDDFRFFFQGVKAVFKLFVLRYKSRCPCVQKPAYNLLLRQYKPAFWCGAVHRYNQYGGIAGVYQVAYKLLRTFLSGTRAARAVRSSAIFLPLTELTAIHFTPRIFS